MWHRCREMPSFADAVARVSGAADDEQGPDEMLAAADRIFRAFR